uniref:Putative reverse transcriptase domain-containing protein n=1 Tax=Tanacetum cinerariifolium TaxID=118510 RepID=A0A6L2NS62_TANCI|nr:putative reverse transcriptase domain-containing protein [Tanacetum cinerariifolium]
MGVLGRGVGKCLGEVQVYGVLSGEDIQWCVLGGKRGMDWLSKLRAKIVCCEKIVQILLSNEDILEVHGESPKGNLKHLKTMKVNEPKLEDIPVVREFPSVFLKDLLGLPPSREVEFRIDLIPEAVSIAKSPYRLVPTDFFG